MFSAASGPLAPEAAVFLRLPEDQPPDKRRPLPFSGGYFLWTCGSWPLVFRFNSLILLMAPEGRCESVSAGQKDLAETVALVGRPRPDQPFMFIDPGALNSNRTISFGRLTVIVPHMMDSGGFRWAAATPFNEVIRYQR